MQIFDHTSWEKFSTPDFSKAMIHIDEEDNRIRIMYDPGGDISQIVSSSIMVVIGHNDWEN